MLRLVSVFLCLTIVSLANADEAFPPHKVAGNLYYVGSRDISSYLVTTSKGHGLLKATVDEHVPLRSRHQTTGDVP